MKVFDLLATLKNIVLLTCLLGSNCFAEGISSELLKKDYKFDGSCEVKRAGIKYKSDRYSPKTSGFMYAIMTIERDGVVFTDAGPMYYFFDSVSCAEITDGGVVIANGVDLDYGAVYLTFIDVVSKEKRILSHNKRVSPKMIKVQPNSYLVMGFTICEHQTGFDAADGANCQQYNDSEKEANAKLRNTLGVRVSPFVNGYGSGMFNYYTFPKSISVEVLKPEFRIFLNEIMINADELNKGGDKQEFLDTLLALIGMLDKLKRFGIEVTDKDLANRYQIPNSTIVAMRSYWSDISSN